jgi:hypothetical protein
MATEENFLGDERSHGKKELDDGKRRKRKKNEFFFATFYYSVGLVDYLHKATNTIEIRKQSSSSRNNIVII